VTPINKQNNTKKRYISVYDIKPLPLDENTSLGTSLQALMPIGGKPLPTLRDVTTEQLVSKEDPNELYTDVLKIGEGYVQANLSSRPLFRTA
jgi:hypothetical protein